MSYVNKSTRGVRCGELFELFKGGVLINILLAKLWQSEVATE